MKIKQKDRYWSLFLCPLHALFQMECSFTKVLQKCSLTKVTILHSLWNCKNCIKMGKTKKGVVWEAKHKPCMFGIIIRSWLSNMWCFVRLGTIYTNCKGFCHYITNTATIKYYDYVLRLYYCYINSQFTIL